MPTPFLRLSKSADCLPGFLAHRGEDREADVDFPDLLVGRENRHQAKAFWPSTSNCGCWTIAAL
jgi:hypothetical protein